MKPGIMLIAGLCCALLNAAAQQFKKERVEYKEGDTVLEGLLVYSPAKVGQGEKRPGILIAHQWKGLSAYEEKRAEMLAELGYVVFAADVYGKGVRPSNPQDAGRLAGEYKKNRALLRRRIQAGLAQLQKNALVDTKRIGAIGYCFGGTTVIELARSGADIAGVVSFHGGLDSPNPGDGKNIKAKVLACHGADDPFVPPADVKAFEDELRAAKVDWQLIAYGNAVHSFTDWNAGSDPSKGAAYNEKADHRSWQAMQDFFAELFGENGQR